MKLFLTGKEVRMIHALRQSKKATTPHSPFRNNSLASMTIVFNLQETYRGNVPCFLQATKQIHPMTLTVVSLIPKMFRTYPNIFLNLKSELKTPQTQR